MKIVKGKIELAELQEICKNGVFVEVVKAVVDIQKGIMAIDAEMHRDLADELVVKEGSRDENLWGVNLFPAELGDKFIFFTSLINIKPGINKSLGIDIPEIREKVIATINSLVKR